MKVTRIVALMVVAAGCSGEKAPAGAPSPEPLPTPTTGAGGTAAGAGRGGAMAAGMGGVGAPGAGGRGGGGGTPVPPDAATASMPRDAGAPPADAARPPDGPATAPATGRHRLLYVASAGMSGSPGTVDVFDIDQGHKLLRKIQAPI